MWSVSSEIVPVGMYEISKYILVRKVKFLILFDNDKEWGITPSGWIHNSCNNIQHRLLHLYFSDNKAWEITPMEWYITLAHYNRDCNTCTLVMTGNGR